MKARIKIVGILVILGSLAGTSRGTTIGFVGAGGENNEDIRADYGSHIGAGNYPGDPEPTYITWPGPDGAAPLTA